MSHSGPYGGVHPYSKLSENELNKLQIVDCINVLSLGTWLHGLPLTLTIPRKLVLILSLSHETKSANAIATDIKDKIKAIISQNHRICESGI